MYIFLLALMDLTWSQVFIALVYCDIGDSVTQRSQKLCHPEQYSKSDLLSEAKEKPEGVESYDGISIQNTLMASSIKKETDKARKEKLRGGSNVCVILQIPLHQRQLKEVHNAVGVTSP
jgi:hypothetical protein